MEHLGLVGLSESGHAQLFSALTGLDASTATDRVLGVVAVPDERLDALAAMSASKKVVPTTLQVAFIPGLSTEPGKGIGSRLLGLLRDCDAILFVLRASDGNDPQVDLEILEYELVLADLASVEQRLYKQQRALKGDKSLAKEIGALSKAAEVLGDGIPIYRSTLTDEDRELLGSVFLLTNKKALSVVNISVDDLERGGEIAAPFGDDAIAVCIEIEGDPDVVAATGVERAELLSDLGVVESVVPRLARAAQQLLGRRTFFTTGDKESHAWVFRAGAKAPECAGVIHSDLQRGFIRAEIIHWDELLEIGSWNKAKDLGKLRVEGKDYTVADGDVVEIRFNI